MSGSRFWVRFGAALALVAAVKLLIGLPLGAHPLLVPEGELDGAYYRHFAERVLAGDVRLLRSDSFFGHPPAPFFISPLYIYALALFLKIGGSLAAARVMQLVLGTAAVALVALTARRWFGTRAMWLAGGLSAGCGLFTFYESLILQAAIDPFLTALDLYLVTRALQDGRRRDWIAAGAAIGLHALNRPNMLLVAGGLALAVALWRRGSSKYEVRSSKKDAGQGLSEAALFLLAAAVIIAPVTVRNYRASGEFIPISSHGGLNFFIGNGPEADGTFVSAMGVEPSIKGQWLDAPRVASEQAGRTLSVAETSAFFRDQALAWIRTHPVDAAVLVLRKSWYVLSGTFLTLNHSYPFFAHDSGSGLRFLAIGPAVLVPFGLVGLLFARPRRPGFLIWAAFVPLSLLSVAVFFVAARYRLPLQMALAVAGGGGLSWIWDKVRGREWRSLVSAASVAAIALTLVLWPTGLDDGRAEEQVRMGLYELEKGSVESGERWIARAIAAHGFPGVVHLRAGQVYESKARWDDAVRHYEAAIGIDPDEAAVKVAAARVHERAGLALVLAGRHGEAIDVFAKAIARNPRVASFHLNRAVALAMSGRTAEARQEAKTALEIDPGYEKARQFLRSVK